MPCVLGVIARSTSSYTGPAGAIGTSLPDNCLFAEPTYTNAIYIFNMSHINPLTFSFLCDSD